MTTTSELIDAILKERGLSRRKLAIKAGIPPSSFQSAMERGENFSFKMLMKIAAALNVEWLELVPEGQRAGMVIEHIRKKLRDEKPVTPKDRVEAAFERLSPEGQQAAAERLEELALLEKYQKKEPSDGS